MTEEVPEFPKPLAPAHPPFSPRWIGRRGPRRTPCVLDAGDVRFGVGGRTAIALALRRLDIGPGAKVLAPAYHCTAMIEPIVAAGAEPVFYRVREDTSVDLEDAAAKADGAARALLAVHYFGWPQDGGALRAFCDARGWALLED
ncbi:MAG: DegT/DnrJ/EryC1/StrS family aminotransferase, partial [Planctomycetota bacterium]